MDLSLSFELRGYLRFLPLLVVCLLMLSLPHTAVFATSGLTLTQTSNPIDNFAINPRLVPPMPAKLGCYVYTKNTGWQSTPCLSPIMAENVPRPMEGGGYGIEGIGGGGGTLNSGYTQVLFSKFSGESDSKYGSNDWSVQFNTNFFTGNNGQTDWVQFVEQNYPTYLTFFGYAIFCVWQVDVTTQSYPNKCVNTDIQHLSNSYSSSDSGYLSQSGGTEYLNGQYCGPSKCWGVTVTDNNGLTGRWSDGSGTILGMGDKSTANFISPTSLTAYVELQAPTNSYFNSNAHSEVTSVTAEMNNLNPGSASLTCGYNDPLYTYYFCTVSTPSSN